MERNCEGRRGGIGGLNSSSTRRKAYVVQNFNGDFKNKRRKRHGLVESRFYGAAVGMYETAKEIERPMSEGAEEDDDMRALTTIHRRSGKPKSHWKEDGAGPIDMAAVPRKLRTAMIKRYQDSLPWPDVDNSKQQQPSNAELLNSSTLSAVSNVTLKPSRRMKPHNHKSCTAKMVKVSPPTISKQEEEVAETLYDLSRMFMDQAVASVPDANTVDKVELKSEVKMEATNSISGPAVASIACPITVTSSSSIVTSPAADIRPPSPADNRSALGASKRKHVYASCKLNDGDQPVAVSLASISATGLLANSLELVTRSVDAEQAVCLSFDKGQVQTEANTNPEAVPMIVSMAGSCSMSPNTLLLDQLLCDIEEPPATSFGKVQRTEAGSPSPIEMDKITSISVEKKAAGVNPAGSMNASDKAGEVVENLTESGTFTDAEFGNRVLQLLPVGGSSPNKFGFDLMVPPRSSDKPDGITNPKMVDAKKKEEELQVDFNPTFASDNALLDKDIDRNKEIDKTENTEFHAENEQPSEKLDHDKCRVLEPEKINQKFSQSDNHGDSLKDGEKQEESKEILNGTISVAPMIATTVSSASCTVSSMPTDMSDCSGGLRTLGCYLPMAIAAAAAAALPMPLSVARSSSVDRNNAPAPQLHSFFHRKQSWQHCAMHVFITHFIDCQRRLKHNPLLAAAYENSTDFCGAKAYNLNIPFSCDDAICASSVGRGVMGASITSALVPGSRASGLGVRSTKENYRATASSAPNLQRFADTSPISCIEALGRKSPSQHQIQTAQQQPSLSLQVGPACGFPIPQSVAASAIGTDAGKGILAGVNMEGTLVVAKSTSTSSSLIGASVVGAGSGPPKGSITNAAAVQAQFLPSAIHNSSFPVSFSPDALGSTFSGRMTPLQVADMTSGSTASPKQLQGAHTFGSSGFSQQCQHQQPSSPLHVTQTPLGAGSQHSLHVHDKENVAVDLASSPETKLFAAHKNIYGHNSPPVQIPFVNSPCLLLASGMPALAVHPQDCSPMSAFRKKQAKSMQQEQCRLMPQLQQQYVTAEYSSSPSLQMGLQGVGSHISHSSSMNASTNRGPTSPGSSEPPAGISVMVQKGHVVLQSMDDPLRVSGQHLVSSNRQLGAGHFPELSISPSQQQPMLKAVSGGIKDGRNNISEGNNGNGRQREDTKLPPKNRLNRPNSLSAILESYPKNDTYIVTRNAGSSANLIAPDSEGGAYVSVSRPITAPPPNQSPKKLMVRPKAVSSPVSSSSAVDLRSVTCLDRTSGYADAFDKILPGQGLPSPAKNVNTITQEVRQGHTHQQLSQIRNAQRRSDGSPSTAGELSKSQQLTTNGAHVSRIPSISSSSDATPPPMLPVSKSGDATVAKNAASINSSYSLSQKWLSETTSLKRNSPANIPSLPSKYLQAQMVQNQRNMQIQQQQQNQQRQPQQQQNQQHQHQQQQQHIPQLLLRHTNHSMQQQDAKPHLYHLPESPSIRQEHQLQEQSLPQQVRHNLFMQQNPQYVQTHSQIHAQTISQQSMMHQQQILWQLKQQSGQICSRSQQLGSIQQLQFKHLEMQSVPPTSFGMAANGDLFPLIPGASNTGTTGNARQSVVSDAAVISQSAAPRPPVPAKSTDNVSSQRSNCARLGFLHGENSEPNDVISSQQQFRNSSTVSSLYPMSLSQPMSNSGMVANVSDDKPMTGN